MSKLSIVLIGKSNLYFSCNTVHCNLLVIIQRAFPGEFGQLETVQHFSVLSP